MSVCLSLVADRRALHKISLHVSTGHDPFRFAAGVVVRKLLPRLVATSSAPNLDAPSYGMSSPGGPRGDPPIPSAVAFVHREYNATGDTASDSGIVFIGPPSLQPARQALAWLIHHGFSVRLEYFHDLAAARARYPHVPSDIGHDVLRQGSAILAADPSILNRVLTPRATASTAPGAYLFSPFSASQPLRSASPPPTTNINSTASTVITSTQNNDTTTIIMGSSAPTIPTSLPQPPFPSTSSTVEGISIDTGGGHRASYHAADPPSMGGSMVQNLRGGVVFGSGGSVLPLRLGTSVVHPQLVGSVKHPSLVGSVHHQSLGGSVHHPPLVGSVLPLAPGGSVLHPMQVRPTMEPEALTADEAILPRVPHTLTVPAASVAVSDPTSATMGGSPVGTLSGSMETGSSSSASLPPAQASPPIPLASSLSPVPPAATSASDLTTEEEDRVAASLIKSMPAFAGGSRGEKDWPLFWARLSSIMKLTRYSPLGSALITTHENAGNSNRLHFLLLSKLTDASMSSFYHNPEFDGKGFEMVAHLCQQYAPSKASDVFVNMQSLMFMEMKVHESIPEFAARIRTTNTLLQAGGETINPSLLTMLLMRNLPDAFEPLKADCSLYPEKYATMTINDLEKKAIQWAIGKKIYSPDFAAAAVGTGSAVAVGGGSAVKGTPTPPSSSPSSVVNHEQLTKMRSSGICHCNRTDHKLEDCVQFMLAGYVIDYNPEKAKEKKAAFSPKKKKGKKKSGAESPATSASATTPSVPAPPAPSGSSSVGGAAHTSANRFAGFDSDDSDGDDLSRDVGIRVASYASAVCKSNSASALYPSASANIGVTSICIGTSSHVAASHATLSSVVIADSGATDHMWPDYSTFTSYRPLTSKHVTLADNNTAPVAGIGSIKILLDGHVVGVRNVLHVPSLRVPLYSLRAHRTMDGCGFIGDNNHFHVYFPTFVVTVDDTIDSHITYSPLGRTSKLPYDFHQPRLPSSTASATTTAPAHQATVIPFSPSEISPNQCSYDEEFPPLQCLVAPSVSRPSSPTSVITPLSSTVAPPLPPTPPTTNGRVSSPKRISQEALRAFLLDDVLSPPPIRPCDTPNGSDTTRHLTADKIYRLFGHRRFRNYQNFCLAAKDSKFINGGEPVPSLGEFATIPKRARGAPLPRPRRALERVHIDIVFGDGLGRLGYRYALVLVDRATRYIWVLGLKSLHADALIAAFSQFRAEAGRLAVQFRSDCDAKLLSQQVVSWLREHGSDIVSAPAGRQSSNGLVERNWRTMVEMARSYLTDMQMPRAFWFPAIQHAARMMNCIPGKINDALTTPFELLHHSPPDSRLWFPLFSVGYFHHTRDGSVARSGFQAQTLEGIAIGRSDTSNAMLFYNPTTKQYYEPDTYKLDPSRLPSTVWPLTIKYDGGIFADLYRDATPHIPEPFPPGTRVLVCTPGAIEPSEGTISSIPLKSETGANESESYMVLLDNGTATPATLSELRALSSVSTDTVAPTSALPGFLAANSKVILAKDGLFHKGFLLHLHNGRYRFSVRHRINSKREEWGVDLPSFESEWPVMCMENQLIPSWIVPPGIVPPTVDPSYLVHTLPAASAATSKSAPSFWDVPINMPVVISTSAGSTSHVSARGCVRPCPPSLQKALDPSHPDRHTWLESYYEEKGSLLDVDTFSVISLDDYRRLRQEGAPQAIPSMCVLVIKTDEAGQPDRAKSRIVVLGNLENRTWGKHERAAPVLKYSSLRLMVSAAIERRRKLKQADYKNAFCNPTLPDDEVTIIRPPLGDPDAQPGEYWLLKKTLYGLRRSPKHWYDMASAALLAMGLKQSAHDPCLFHGIPSSADCPAEPTDDPLTVGLYVDDMVYFSASDNIEQRFEQILGSQFKISFMGVVNWFLGTHFTWIDRPHGDISVHLSQVAFAQNLVERYRQQNINLNPKATPYRSGLPIDSLPAYTGDMDDPAFLRLRLQYQSIVGSINWLATNTRPDLAPVTSFLGAYNHVPTQQHMDAALYAIKYICNTAEYGIAFHSDSHKPVSAYVHFPFHHDLEAYNDALPPTAAEHHELTAYSDACWGSQLGGSAPQGSEIEMFKLRSMSGYMVVRAGGPVAWSSVRQERTSRSSCEAEVRATDECAKEVLSIRLRGKDIGLTDDTKPTTVHNDNQGCVDWCKTTTTSGMKHLDLRGNAVRESIQLGELSIHHIPGVINCADIFTKELKDASHFCLLRDSFMMDRSNFDRLDHS